jgi:hypothetical protein
VIQEDRTQPIGRLCSVVSKSSGEDPAGSGAPFASYLLLEIPPPWRGDITESPGLSREMCAAVAEARDAGAIDRFTGFMPDPEYSLEGHTRAFLFQRPEGPFAAYEKRDYLLPQEEVVAFARSLPEPDGLSRFEHYRQETEQVREIFTCTHGANDACCGKFGFPIYNLLRFKYAGPGRLRVWRASHIGGHRFAPTLIDLPEGRYWGHLELKHLENLVLRNGPVFELGRLCRGWAGVEDHFEQIAERELLVREGWKWTQYRKTARLLEETEERGRVRLEYEDPGGKGGAYEITIEASGSVTTLDRSGGEPYETPQYHVSRLEKK